MPLKNLLPAENMLLEAGCVVLGAADPKKANTYERVAEDVVYHTHVRSFRIGEAVYHLKRWKFSRINARHGFRNFALIPH